MQVVDNVLSEVAASLLEAPECLAPDIEGFTSARVRMFLHRLVERLPTGEAYFEVGCLRGATLVSALLDQRGAIAHACDNWSQFLDWDARDHFQANLESYKYRLPDIRVHEEDCFGLARKGPFPAPVGLYFYDGDHDTEAQRRAIVEFRGHFAPETIVIVDDWNWDHVRAGAWTGIGQLRAREVSFLELPGNTEGDAEKYWNGLGAFHLKLR